MGKTPRSLHPTTTASCHLRHRCLQLSCSSAIYVCTTADRHHLQLHCRQPPEAFTNHSCRAATTTCSPAATCHPKPPTNHSSQPPNRHHHLQPRCSQPPEASNQPQQSVAEVARSSQTATTACSQSPEAFRRVQLDLEGPPKPPPHHQFWQPLSRASFQSASAAPSSKELKES